MSKRALELIAKEKKTGKLDLSFQNLEEIPEQIRELHWLKTLNLSSNLISDISVLKGLEQLQTLYLSDNQISDISFLKGLSKTSLSNRLDISNNKVEDLSPILSLIERGRPVKWDYLKNGICVQDNQFTNPPVEIVKKGNEAIINYFKELKTQSEVPLYEAKLLIIGEGGSGKTSLARRLLDEKAEMPKEKESTKGIDIFHYDFKTAAGQDFRINIWDFGGQEIYHATHQFFLTKRSLYILLDDTRKDDKTVNDASFKYWFQVVELLSENSPVVIVQNEKADRSKQLDLKSMQGRFENVKGSWATNILTCRGLEQVRSEIEHQVQQLPLVGQMLPKQWVEIRRALEDLAANGKNHISLEDYFELCGEHKIPEEDRALWLSSYLHDLGAFLHFKEDLVLRDLFILKNSWATDAVYKVLDNEKVKGNFGYFTAQNLDEIWKARAYRSKHPQLLALMQKFQLCYELMDRSERTWLAPQLLPVEAPDYEWNSENNLILRYRYCFMPKGLLSRFFVRMSRYVKEPERAWRSGVFLQRENTEALVKETYGSQEIVIQVEGAHPKELMTIISEEFDKMNGSYGEKLRVKKLIPCICKDYKSNTKPHFYDYKNLKRRKEKGKMTTECEVSFEDVSVLGLLDGIFVAKEQIQPTKQDLKTDQNAGLKTVEIFLASSNELKAERDAIEVWIGRENKRLVKKGLFLQLNLWEDFLDSMSKTRKQDDYNKAVLRSEIFISLFATKVGKYTEEEFREAYDSFMKDGETEFIYTYFKNTGSSLLDMPEEQILNFKRFQKSLSTEGHFYTRFDNAKDLVSQLKTQLQKIIDQKRWTL